jgi:hypothetical protein
MTATSAPAGYSVLRDIRQLSTLSALIAMPINGNRSGHSISYVEWFGDAAFPTGRVPLFDLLPVLEAAARSVGAATRPRCQPCSGDRLLKRIG